MSSLTRAKLDTTGSLPEGSRKRSTRSKSTKKKTKRQKRNDFFDSDRLRLPQSKAAKQLAATVASRDVIFAPNPGPQTDFLAAPEREVLYGGAAGGGKSYAMLADPLRYLPHPQFSGLLLRHTLKNYGNLSGKPRAVPKNLPRHQVE